MLVDTVVWIDDRRRGDPIQNAFPDRGLKP